MQSKDVQQQMFEYIDQWRQSDLTQKAFCQMVKSFLSHFPLLV